MDRRHLLIDKFITRWTCTYQIFGTLKGPVKRHGGRYIAQSIDCRVHAVTFKLFLETCVMRNLHSCTCTCKSLHFLWNYRHTNQVMSTKNVHNMIWVFCIIILMKCKCGFQIIPKH